MTTTTFSVLVRALIHGWTQQEINDYYRWVNES